MFKKVGVKVGKKLKKIINSIRNFSNIKIYCKLPALQNKNEFAFTIIIISIFANVKFSLFGTSIAL